MERVIITVMCAGLILLLFVGLGWADTRVLLTPSNDTFFFWGNFATEAQKLDDSNMTRVQGNKSYMITHERDNNQANWYAYMKINISSLQSKVISLPNITYQRKGACGSLPFKVGITTNASWNDSMTNSTGMAVMHPDANFSNALSYVDSSGLPATYFKGSGNLTMASRVMNILYNNSDDIVTFVMMPSSGSYSCGNDGDQVVIASMEQGTPVNFSFTSGDYLSGGWSITDTYGICFDFESGTYTNVTDDDAIINDWSSCDTSLPDWDFFFNAWANKIVPKEPVAFGTRDSYSTNVSIGQLDCNLFGPSAYTYNQYSNVNPPATPKLYDKFCFNQSYVHAVPGFYGAIKVINNSDVRYSAQCPLPGSGCPDLDFYWAIYSPSFATFSAPDLYPNPPIASINLTVKWTTTIPMIGGVQLRYNKTGNYSAYYYFYDANKSYETTHIVVIPGDYILPAYYEYYLIGNSTDGTNYTSIIYNFSVTGDRTSWVTENATVPGMMQELVNNGIVPDLDTAYLLVGVLIVSGFSMFIMVIGNSPKLGILAFISLLVAWSTALYIPTSFVLVIIVFASLIIAKIVGKFWG